MASKSTLQMGEGTTRFSALSGSMSWANGDIALPWETNSSARRRLLSSDMNVSTRPVIWSLLIVWPALALHYIAVATLDMYGKRPKGLLDFPQLPITVASILINPYASTAARMLAIGDNSSVLLAIVFLLLVPAPLVVYATVQVRRACRTMFYTRTRANKAAWLGDRATLNKYGAFFKNLQGPTYVYQDAGAMYDKGFGRFMHTRPVLESECGKRALARLFFVPYEYARNVLVLLVLGASTKAPLDGNLGQVVMLWLITCTHLLTVGWMRPHARGHSHIVEVLSTLGELGTYSAACLLVIVRRLNANLVPSVIPIADQLLVAAQVIAIASKIIGQGHALIHVLPILKRKVREKLTPAQVTRADRARVLAFKYGCRWHHNTFARYPKSRATYFISRNATNILENPQNRANFLTLKYLV
jgi:hypothetical protein